MKNVLLLVHDDAGQVSRFQAALDLTRALDGHLTCLDVVVTPIIFGEFDAGFAQSIMIADELQREAANRTRLEARLAAENVPWSWVDVTGTLALALKHNSDLADIIVVSRQLDSEDLPDMFGVASEVVIGSGKIVLAVPESARGFAAAGHAMVAWDGSDEAVKALQASVPLLQLARTVTVVEVRDGTLDRPAEEAATYLSRHDVKPVVISRRNRGLATGDALLVEAKAEGADYIVMGAFGRSRIVEAILGGVSREMLKESPIPVVMSH